MTQQDSALPSFLFAYVTISSATMVSDGKLLGSVLESPHISSSIDRLSVGGVLVETTRLLAILTGARYPIWSSISSVAIRHGVHLISDIG